MKATVRVRRKKLEYGVKVSNLRIRFQAVFIDLRDESRTLGFVWFYILDPS